MTQHQKTELPDEIYYEPVNGRKAKSHEKVVACFERTRPAKAVQGDKAFGYEIMGDTLFFGVLRKDRVKLDEIWYTVYLAGYTEEYKQRAIARAEYLGAVFCSGKSSAALTPESEGIAGKANDWIKAQPAETYDALKKQFMALRGMVNTMGQQLSHYHKKSYETGEAHLKQLQESLESERAMNAQLTDELSTLTRPQEIDVEAIKGKALDDYEMWGKSSREFICQLIDHLASSGRLK